MLKKLLTYEVDLSKRKNKILTAFSVLIVATMAWIFLLPVLNPCGIWLCHDERNQITNYVIIRENTSSAGYTVMILSSEAGTINAQSKNNLIAAWLWRAQILNSYTTIKPITQDVTIDNLRR